MKKLYPSKIALFKSYIWIALMIIILLYGIFSSRFAWAYSEEESITGYIIQDVITLVVSIAIDFVLWFLLISKNYYEIIKCGIVHHKLGQETSYDFDHVIYINDEYTIKHKTLLFYNERGKELFLTLDKEGKLYEIFKKECKKLISKEEFHEKFPKIKL